MRWWRQHRRLGARVALLALLLQLALSFGHVHAPQIGQPGATVTIAADAAAAPQQPADDHGDDYCAICAVLALLSGAQTAAAPVVSTPAAHAIAVVAIEITTLRLAARHDSFRPRAPPVS